MFHILIHNRISEMHYLYMTCKALNSRPVARKNQYPEHNKTMNLNWFKIICFYLSQDSTQTVV